MAAAVNRETALDVKAEVDRAGGRLQVPGSPLRADDASRRRPTSDEPALISAAAAQTAEEIMAAAAASPARFNRGYIQTPGSFVPPAGKGQGRWCRPRLR